MPDMPTQSPPPDVAVTPQPAPAPVPTPAPVVPPSVPPTPPPAPPTPTHNASRLAPVIGVVVILLAAAALLLLKNPWLPQPPSPMAPANPPPTPIVAPTPPEATTTTEPTYQTTVTSTHALGETVQFFLDNDVVFHDPKNPSHLFTVTAVEFTDSRCKPGVQCIWAGELGVRLRVTDQATGQSEDVSLGMVRALNGSALGLTFTLKNIDEGKGGTYAEIIVE